MNLLDRLLGHDSWTTRQLLLACADLPAEAWTREFAIDHRSLQRSFEHIIANMEIWTDLLAERPVQEKSGNSIAELLARHQLVSREFAQLARAIAAQNRWDDCFWDTLDAPPRRKTYAGAIGHLLTHSMHHRAQIMWLMEQVGLQEHIEGDLLSWESHAFGWAD